MARLSQVAEVRSEPPTKPLSDAVARRAARVGGLRIICTVDRDQRIADTSDIGPRGQGYRDLSEHA